MLVPDGHTQNLRQSSARTPAIGVTNTSVGGVSLPSLGKNSVSPKSEDGKKKKTKKVSPNRDLIRVAVASRLTAGYYTKTGKNLKGSSVAGCQRWKAWNFPKDRAEIKVTTYQVMEDGVPTIKRTARFHGHFICGNSWTCDHCARTTVARMRSWIRAGFIPALEPLDLTTSMLTLTMAHSYSDDWREVVATLMEAYAKFDKAMNYSYLAVGSLGKIRSLEAPIGANGIHPHLHVLITHKKGADLNDIRTKGFELWTKIIGQLGKNCNEHGFDLKENCIEDYIAKLETSHEIAAHETKTTRKKGSSLGQLLDRCGRGDIKSGEEWIRAIEALAGKKRFHTGDIAKKLGIPSYTEWDDTQEGEEEKEKRLERIKVDEKIISYAQYMHMAATVPRSKRAGLALIRRAARSGNHQKVYAMVEALIDDCPDLVQRIFTNDYMKEILLVCSTRPMTKDEVPVYIEAKRKLAKGNIDFDIPERILEVV